MAKLRFNFPVWNHVESSQETLVDLHGPIKAALAALGYADAAAVGDPRAASDETADAISIFTENFTSEDAAAILGKGQPFGILCTEMFDGRKLARCSDRRSDTFLELARHAAFIWDAVGQPHYRDFGIPYGYLPCAWEPLCHRPQTIDPDYDFCVYGYMNLKRITLKKKLESSQVSHIWIPYGTLREKRDLTIARSRFVLGLPATGNPEGMSGTRVSTALYADRPILEVKDIARLDELRSRWREIYDEQLLEWRSRPSMRDFLTQAIADTISMPVHIRKAGSR